MANFVSLHNQTDFSILDSTISVKDLFKRAKELEQTAVAITDHGTIAAAWDALKASRDTGVKLIMGCECYFVPDAKSHEGKFKHIVLLAKNAVGYRNLLTLNRKGFDTEQFVGKKIYSVIDWNLLEEYKEGLICLTACGNGIISQSLMNKEFDQAEKDLLRLKSMFGNDLGIEVQPNNMKRFANAYNDEIDQQFLNDRLIKFGKKHGIKVVPACNAHYLKKEDHEVHDALLAIGSHQPIHSNFRLKYNVPEFYLKSGDEVKKFFSRNFGEDFAQEICDNSVSFANSCEFPDWIDPKFSNPSGRELAEFPVKNAADYPEFIKWLDLQSDELKKLEEDKLYLRYLCNNAFEQYKYSVPIENHKIYLDRINEEIETLEYQGFSSYMLIVADYVQWCIKNGIGVGPGRGCVDRDTNVLTENGYKQIVDVKIGDMVYSHTGALQKVVNTFEFDVNDEELINIKSEKAFGTMSLTQDHKLLALRKEHFKVHHGKKYGKRHGSPNWHKTNQNKIAWMEAKDIKQTDLLWMQYPSNIIIQQFNDGVIDLAKFSTFGVVKDDCIEYAVNAPNKFSVSRVSKDSGLPSGIVRKIKNSLDESKFSKKMDLVAVDLKKYLNLNGMSLDDWRNHQAIQPRKINRFLKIDEEFYYLLGLWVGDGFLINSKSRYKYGIGISHHSNEIENLSKIKKYLDSKGFSTSIFNKKEKAIQLECYGEVILKLFQHLFPNYKNSSSTKHLPIYFRSLNNNNLKKLINGLFDSDGHANQKGSNEIITTTSKQLALEIKEALLYLKKASSILTPKIYTKDGANRKQAYVLTFNSLFDSIGHENSNFYKENGYLCAISEIKKIKIDKVYDIEVENDHSYLTTNCASHNSVGGCFVAFLLGIHKADSIKYGLIFERFQNKLRMQPPDIDQDVSTQNRGKVLDYLRDKYGKDNFCNISNYNTVTPKVYVRDIARAYELGGDKDEAVKIGNDIAGIISNDSAKLHNFEQLVNDTPILGEYCLRYPVIRKNSQILGAPRARGQHAAGVVLSKRPIVGLAPLRKEADNSIVIEYDKDLAEANGFVKMDVLGLSTLDTIDNAIIEISKSKKPFNNEHLNYENNDKKTYDLISKGNTFCVFQLGTSSGTIDLCKKMKPKNIEDLALITTLARPAAATIRKDFIEVREGKKTAQLLHPSLKSAFEKTHGYGLFDESILQLGKDVAGWNYNDADRIRKMIKEKGKNPDKDKKLMQEFVEGAISKGIPQEIANRIVNEEISKFQGYTFNKSHAVVYSMVSYQTAYLKAHFPLEFLLANLMAEVNSGTPDRVANIEKIKKEIRDTGIEIVPPNINTSQLSYTIVDGDKLTTGLDALKFVSEDAIKDILEKRPFTSFLDFVSRVDATKVRANTIQALAASGCLDEFNVPRKLMFLYISDYRKKLQVWMKKHDPKTEEFNYPWPEEKPWKLSETYALEHYYLGDSFVCKPADAYGDFFKDDHKTALDVRKSKDKTKLVPVKGIIRDFFEFKIKKEDSKYYGQSMIKAVLEDKDGNQCPCTMFPDGWSMVQYRIKQIKKSAKFDSGIALSFAGSANNYADDMGVVLESLFDLSMAPAVPDDLKPRKVNLKTAKKEKVKNEKPKNSKDLFEEIEDELYNEGLIELNEDVDID